MLSLEATIRRAPVGEIAASVIGEGVKRGVLKGLSKWGWDLVERRRRVPQAPNM